MFKCEAIPERLKTVQQQHIHTLVHTVSENAKERERINSTTNNIYSSLPKCQTNKQTIDRVERQKKKHTSNSDECKRTDQFGVLCDDLIRIFESVYL